MSEGTARANALLEEAAREARDEITGILRDVGLSGHAASVLYALTRLPEATAGDLILKTGIPDSKIYYALRELVEMGLVEVQEGKPRTYRMLGPREAGRGLQRVLEAKYERERAAITRVVSLLEPLRSASESPSMDLAYIVKGMVNVKARAEAMVASAKREVLLMSSDEAFFHKLEGTLVKAARRGVKVRMAVPEIEIEAELARLGEVRSIVCSCLVLVVDGQQILTVNETSDGSAYGILSTDETLVRMGLDYWDSPRCCVECG